MPRYVLMLLVVGSVIASVALNQADWQDPSLWRLQGAAIGMAFGYILGHRRRKSEFSDNYIPILKRYKDFDNKKTKQIIENVLSAEWCKENFVIPCYIEHFDSDANRKDMACIALADLSHLAVIGEFIQQRFKNAGLDCAFEEAHANDIQERLENIFGSVESQDTELERMEILEDMLIKAKLRSNASSQDAELKQIVEHVFTTNWCKDNLVLPYSIVQFDSEANRSHLICIGVSDYKHLDVIGEFIKKQLRANNMELDSFIELTPNEIIEKLDQLAQ